MAGVKITDLPLVDDIKRTDQLLIARGNTTRKVFGSALVTKEDITELFTAISTLSTDNSGIQALTSERIGLYYNPVTRQLSAEILGVIPATHGGTGYNYYTENQILVGDAYGNLQKMELDAGPGLALEMSDAHIIYTNTYELCSIPYSDYILIKSNLYRQEFPIESATEQLAGVMSSTDKINHNSLVRQSITPPLVFTEHLTATSQLLSGSKVSLIDSPSSIEITLPSQALSGACFRFVRAGTGSVTFVAENPSVTIFSTNPFYKKISKQHGEVTAYYKQENEWYLTGDLAPLWDKQITGPDDVSDEQKVGIFTNGSYDSLYFDNTWNKTNINFGSMVVQFNGTSYSVVDFTEDRIGQPFLYKFASELGGPHRDIDAGPTHIGVFTFGAVELSSLA